MTNFSASSEEEEMVEEEVSEEEEAVLAGQRAEECASPERRDIVEACHLLPSSSALEEERKLQRTATGAGQFLLCST